LKNKNGSIASAMAILIIIGGIAAYIARQAVENQKKTLIEKIAIDANTTTHSIFNYLSDVYKCTATFQSTLTPNEIASEVSFDRTVDPVVISAAQSDMKVESNGGKPYGNSKITIGSYSITDSTPYPQLHIMYNNPNDMVKAEFHRALNVYIEWEGTPFASRLTKCQAVASGDQIWAASDGASIYYIGGAAKTGKVGINIGENTPLTSSLEVVGSMKVSQPLDELDATQNARVTAKRFLYVSDQNLKDNIVDVRSPLERTKRLDGVSFEWRDGDVKDFGFIAQEVEKHFPELVYKDSIRGNLSVDYAKLTGVLVEAVKEQQQQIVELREQLKRKKAQSK